MVRPLEVDREATGAGFPGVLRKAATGVGVVMFFLVVGLLQLPDLVHWIGGWGYLVCGGLPVVGGFLMAAEPLRFKAQEGVVGLGQRGWWTCTMTEIFEHWAMWPAVVFSGWMGVEGVRWVMAGEGVVFRTGLAVGVMGCSALSSILFWTLMFAAAETRMSEEGLRIGKAHFSEWEHIERVVDTGDYLEVYDRRAREPSTRVPAGEGTVARALLLKELGDRGIAVEVGGRAQSWGDVALVVAGGAVILIMAAEGVHRWGHPLWTVAAVWAVSIGWQAGCEWWRGVFRLTRAKVVMPAERAETA